MRLSEYKAGTILVDGDGKPCKGKCEAFEEDWNKVDRY